LDFNLGFVNLKKKMKLGLNFEIGKYLEIRKNLEILQEIENLEEIWIKYLKKKLEIRRKNLETF